MADDAKYGIKNVVNNIAPLVYNLSGDAGLAAAAQMAAVAGISFYQQWDKVRELLGDTSQAAAAKQSLEGIQEALSRISRKRRRASAADIAAWLVGLNADAGKANKVLQMDDVVKERVRNQAAAKALEARRTPEQQKDEERFGEVISEEGFAKTRDALAQNIIKKRGTAALLSPEGGPLAGVAGAAAKRRRDDGRPWNGRHERARTWQVRPMPNSSMSTPPNLDVAKN